MRKSLVSGIVLVLIACFATASHAGPFDEVLKRWVKSESFSDAGETVTITATYYASEYIEALAQNEADKNLWTADELEQYKYRLLNNLKLDETIPIKVRFEVRGPSIHLAPFGEQISLWLGGKRYQPVEYDPRFNFKVSDEREGLVHFPRYDEETGKDLLEGAKTAKLQISGSISMAIKPATVDFLWDVSKDDPSKLYSGEAGKRLEIDRLIKRLEKLNDKKAELEEELAEVTSEITEIQQRLEELQ